MLTTDGMRELAYRRPWFYHVVWQPDERSRETVASDGLAPGHSRRYWHPLFMPRRGHVYLATTSHYLSEWWMQSRSGNDVYAVATRFLSAGRINPDEDHFSADSVDTCDRFRLSRPADMELWKLFGSVAVPSYGDWADEVGLGSVPAHTAFSVSKGSVAYAGVVPPKALLRWDEGARVWRRNESLGLL